MMMLEPLGVSAAVVALAEIGDKTQLLAIVLAAKYRKPVPIILGILAATLANHALAAWVGFAVSQWIRGDLFQIAVGVAFIVMAGWALIPAHTLVDAVTFHGAAGARYSTMPRTSPFTHSTPDGAS